MTHLFTSKAVDLGRQLLEAFPALGTALDAVSAFPVTSYVLLKRVKLNLAFEVHPQSALLCR